MIIKRTPKEVSVRLVTAGMDEARMKRVEGRVGRRIEGVSGPLIKTKVVRELVRLNEARLTLITKARNESEACEVWMAEAEYK